MQKQLFAVASLVAFIFLTSTNLVEGQLPRDRKCPNVTTKPNFNIDGYFGRWFIVKKYPEFNIEGGHCATAEYYDIGNAEFSVNITQLDINNQVRTLMGSGRVVGNARFLEHFTISPAGVEYNYWIMDTDYKNYAVQYRCDETATGSNEYLWLFTRDQVPKAKVVKAAEDAMVAHGMNLNDLVVVNQSNCK